MRKPFSISDFPATVEPAAFPARATLYAIGFFFLFFGLGDEGANAAQGRITATVVVVVFCNLCPFFLFRPEHNGSVQRADFVRTAVFGAAQEIIALALVADLATDFRPVRDLIRLTASLGNGRLHGWALHLPDPPLPTVGVPMATGCLDAVLDWIAISCDVKTGSNFF